jgi:hypothetical protein
MKSVSRIWRSVSPIGRQKMNRTAWCLVLAALLSLLISSPPVSAQEGKAAGPEIEEKAMTIFKRMADFLSKAQQLSVTIESEFDVVQDSGEKIEFGETRKIVLRRPDRLRVDTTKRDGAKGGMVFNGKDITAFSMTENVYATVAKPGPVDDAIAYFIDDLDMRLPLAELFSSTVVKTLAEQARAADYVGQATIAGVSCDHLSLRGERVDFQVWVAQGDRPLPQRVIITYARAEGQPQFRAQFNEWNLSPEAPDSLFAFTPSEGTTKIAFAPRRRIEPEPPE